MKPSTFPQCNKTWKAPQGMENCVDLETYSDGEIILSLWRMSWRERLSALFFGKVWHYAWAQRPAPIGLLVQKEVFSEERNDGK